jgi:hypothetical protein
MSSTSEKGHPRNGATFERFVQTVQGFGNSYNPSNTGITITALQAKVTAVNQALTACNVALPAWSVATSQRVEAFKGVYPLSSDIVSTLVAIGFSDAIVEDARKILRRIGGNTSKSNTETTETNPRPTHSTSQRSYDNQLSFFERLVEMVTGLTGYTPNETRLSATGLAAHVTTLRTLNGTVTTAYIALTQARNSRDNALYDLRTGAVTLAKQTKNYVKAVYGKNSPEYKALSQFDFTR